MTQLHLAQQTVKSNV